MSFSRLTAIATLGLMLAVGPAFAQNTVPNPLRSKPAETGSSETTKAKPSDEKTADTQAKPKRQRSAKQLQGDEDMRACGASWRTEKAALQAKGETWRSYLKGCRAQRKAARGA